MKFTESHEWVEVEGDLATVGVTDFAQGELGDIVYVELPEVGDAVKKAGEVAVLESTKAASDVYSPISGRVVEVNTELFDQPELINQDAERAGWLFKLEPKDLGELSLLQDRDQYLQSVGK